MWRARSLGFVKGEVAVERGSDTVVEKTRLPACSPRLQSTLAFYFGQVGSPGCQSIYQVDGL